MKTHILDGSHLTIPEVFDLANKAAHAKLSSTAKRNILRARELVEQWANSGERVYGVTTGFGEFSNVRIKAEDIVQLQENLIFSHAAGAGDPLPSEVVRAMMALRINALAKGFSGIQLSTVELLMEMLNRDIVPVIPSQGSVGASGDLVQLAHLVLAMMGKGKINQKDKRQRTKYKLVESRVVLRKNGLRPVHLTAKEGLALINGTQMMTAYAALAVYQAKRLAKIADIAASISVEALRGSDTAFDERIHRLRPYKGQLAAAKNMRRLMHSSELRESHRRNDTRVQDAYSMRCIPQVHGASRDAIDYVAKVVETEVNSATDNPLIFPESNEIYSVGNFHGQPVALAMDFLGLAVAELGNISERRTAKLLDRYHNCGLPAFLAGDGGVESGLMIEQYTAAALVSENKVLIHPASGDSIPTSANQEDHVSMGTIAARQTRQILRNVEHVLAIELHCGYEALGFRTERPGTGTRKTIQRLRDVIAPLRGDRALSRDIERIVDLIYNDAFAGVLED